MAVKKIMAEIKKARGDITSNAPAAVETPRPPLNPMKKGKQGPIKAAKPAIDGPQPEPYRKGTDRARTTGPTPFERSKAKTINAGTLPSVGRPFVAPVL